MTVRRAPVTQGEISRALKAARKAGAREVSIEGSQIRIILGEAVESAERLKVKLAKRPRSII